MVDSGPTEADEVVEGEVVGNSNDEEESGSRGRTVWQRRVSYASEQVSYASSLAEFGAGVRV